MFSVGRRSRWFPATVWVVACCATVPRSARTLPSYSLALTLGQGKEWPFQPLLVDLDGDGHLDLVATARLADPSLHIWLGDGKGGFSPITPTWTDIGYAALATGDINGDPVDIGKLGGHIPIVSAKDLLREPSPPLAEQCLDATEMAGGYDVWEPRAAACRSSTP